MLGYYEGFYTHTRKNEDKRHMTKLSAFIRVKSSHVAQHCQGSRRIRKPL